MSIPTTGNALDGRAAEIRLVNGSKTITLNCIDDVKIKPDQDAPEKETQKFQGGDAFSVTATGAYGDTTYTCEDRSTDYDDIDEARASAEIWDVTIIGATSGTFTGKGMVYVSEGPTLPAAGKKVPTMTVTVSWTSAKTPSAN